MNNINKPILIVCASSSVGQKVSLRLMNLGHPVGLHYVNNKKSLVNLHKIKNAKKTKLFKSSLKNFNSCKKLIYNFVREFGKPYGLIYCGGQVPWKSWKILKEKDWRDILNQHCIQPFYLVREISKHIKRKGRIVLLSSISAKYGGSTKTIHYASAKGAMEVMIKGLSRELASKEILVNGVRSGFLLNKLQRKIRSKKQIDNRVKKIPIKRPGRPDEVAFIISKFFDKDASFITGEIISASGGD